MLKKIISGGQDGVDTAALFAARECSFETDGWMPKGFKNISNTGHDSASLFGMKETPSSEYPQRTEWNVRDSDYTVIFTDNILSRGTVSAGKALVKHKKEYIVVLLPLHRAGSHDWYMEASRIAHIINQYETVNIAGNRNADEDAVQEFIEQVLSKVRELQEDEAAE